MPLNPADMRGSDRLDRARATADSKHPNNLDVHKIKVTFFTDKSVTLAPKTITGTLPQLRYLITKPVGKTKDVLPLLKLASFGKKKTKDGCYRSNENVTDITGAELDYDGEQIGFDQAVEMVEAMGLCAIVYTSPSHT